ncbi:MAG: DUF3006 domain-containing protein [Ruminococcaceae bacterium]|nr:DUF3006 domain-containing protein [Oscillospiraceae bacterium]
MKVIIDRFEGEYAVVEIEKGHFVDIPACLLVGANEGDVVSINIEKEETEDRKVKIENLMNDLFN